MSNPIQTAVTIIALLSALVSSCTYIHIHSRKLAILILPKMIANSLAAYIVMVDLILVILGDIFRARLGVVFSVVGMLISTLYILQVIASHAVFEKVLGPKWLETIPPYQRQRLSKNWWALRPARLPQARCERDIPFWAIPGTDRHLLCDIWRPEHNAYSSGLALIYLHTGEWHFADKGFGTQPLFRHLVGQGHVVMDVAYRLCPEVDLFGMLGDVQRAVVWMKSNATQFGIDPSRIVLAGGSAGGHLALLAAYTCDYPELIPDDIKGNDLHVKGVVSYYGPPNLRAFFEDGYGKVNPPEKVTKILMNLLGRSSEQRPNLYQKSSPVTYVKPNCPATLIFQCEHDSGVPVDSARDFYRKLIDVGVCAVYVEFPQTDHAFDLQIKGITAIIRKNLHIPPSKNNFEDVSQYSPAAQVAMYDLDRFLALLNI